MRDRLNEFHARGAEVVAIGNGNVAQAQRFALALEMNFPLLTDPSLETYRAAGLKHGVATSLNMRSLRHGIAALKSGFRQSRTQGAPWQQGGALVIGRGGEQRYHFVSQEAGDHPPLESLLTALP